MGRSATAEIGAALRRLREQRGMTTRQLAARIGISGAAVSNIETGRSQTPLSRLQDIARVFGHRVVMILYCPGREDVAVTDLASSEVLHHMAEMGPHDREAIATLARVWSRLSPSTQAVLRTEFQILAESAEDREDSADEPAVENA